MVMVKSTKRKAGTEGRPADDEVPAATEAAPSQKKAKKSKKDKKTNPLPKVVTAAGADESEPPVAAGETKIAAVAAVVDAKLADTDMDTGFDFDSTFKSAPKLETTEDEERKSMRHKVKDKRMKRSDGLFPCKEFDENNGVCKFGDKCKFSHLGVDDKAPKAKDKVKRVKKRHGACLDFLAGDCKFAEKCRYRHVTKADGGKAAERIKNDKLIATCLQGNDEQEVKLKRIMELPEHLRQKARAIFFAKQKSAGFHVKPEPVNKQGAARVAGGSKGVCYGFLRGDCTRGDACIFRHATATEADSAKMENWKKYREKSASEKGAAAKRHAKDDIKKKAGVCFSFQKGECSRGDACIFSH